MKNPLLVPELRDMLAAEAYDEVRDFCDETPAPIAAEFVGALSPEEQRDVLRALEPDKGALLFTHFDDDVKLALLDRLEQVEALDLLARMADEARVAFLETVPEERRDQLRHRLERSKGEQAEEVLEDIAEVEAAEKAPPEEMSAEEIAEELKPLLDIYRFGEGKVERAARAEKGCWVNIVNPPRDALPLIAERFKVPLDFVTSSLDQDETSRIEIEEGATLVIMRVPYFDENNIDVLYFTVPVGFILVNGLILTVCARQGTVLQDFIEGKVRRVIGQGSFLLQVMLRATVRYLSHLKQLNNAANIIQKKLEQETRNRQLLKLFNIDKSLVYFTTSLKSNTLMLERLQRLKVVDVAEPTESLLEDIFIESKQAIEMANIYSDILTGMMDAFASVISNNLNMVMKLLTSLTIIMTIPVFVTSFFGMNVKLPFAGHPLAFAFVLGISVVLIVVVSIYFIKKKWLEM